MDQTCLKELLVIVLVVLAALVVDGKRNIKTNGYSWVVRIEKNGIFKCGGTLLGRQKILTVSGCINERQLEEYSLVFGYQNGDVATNGIKRIEESEDGDLLFITPKGKVDIPDESINRLPRIANAAKNEKVAGKTCVLTGFDDSGEPDVQDVDVVTSSKCSGKNGKKNVCFLAEDSSSCVAKKGSNIKCFVNRRWTLFGLLEEESCDGKYQSAMSISPYRREIERESAREVECEDGEIVCSDMKTCARLCDGVPTCDDGIDEFYCGPKCSANELICPDKLSCALPCNGISECTDGEDELGCGQNCLGNATFICKVGNVSYAVPCDGVEQCSDGSDEDNCASAGGDTYQICAGCAEVAKRCDGNNDCSSNCETINDETDCDTFPFICPNDGVMCDDRTGCATLCDCNDDCSIPKDEVACECESGYSTRNWVEITGYHFRGFKIVNDFSGTVSECKAECLSTSGCVNFAYQISSSNCDLFSEAVFDNIELFYINSLFNFYQRRCAECPL